MKLKTISLFAIMVAMLVPVYAQSESDFEVRQNPDNTLAITGYKGTVKNVVIPSTLYGLKVTTIGESAFREKNLTSVIIPDTVITIEDGYTNDYGRVSGAFYSNKQLSKVILGKSLETIGSYAFYECSQLTEIIIPDSVTRIRERAFMSSGLVNVSFGIGLQYMGNYSFASNQIVELSLPSSLIRIGNCAFDGNKIRKVTFGTNLQYIGASAFRHNQIVELNLPSSLKEIDGGAFANNQIQTIIIPNSVTTISNYESNYPAGWVGAFSTNPIKNVIIPASLAKEGIAGVFLNDSDSASFGKPNGSTITSITVPIDMEEEILKGIFEESLVNFWKNQNKASGTYVKRGPIWTKWRKEDDLVYNADKTTLLFCPVEITGNYTIPNGVNSIGVRAFFNCASLTGITIPNTVVSIGEMAFNSCNSLTDVIIPNSVTSIGELAFNSTSLTSINVDADNATYSSDNGVLYNKSKTILIQYPRGKTGAFIIPDNVTSIGKYAFNSCNSLTTVTIPDSVTSIGEAAFINCNGLASISIPSSVISIGDGSFALCTSLKSVTIPNAVTIIGDYAFQDCKNLTSIALPISIKSINKGTFYRCTGLTSVSIPSSVTSIDNFVFTGCTSLTSVTFQGRIASSQFYAGTNNEPTFPGDLRAKYLAGGVGTYKRASGGTVWTKQ